MCKIHYLTSVRFILWVFSFKMHLHKFTKENFKSVIYLNYAFFDSE